MPHQLNEQSDMGSGLVSSLSAVPEGFCNQTHQDAHNDLLGAIFITGNLHSTGHP